MNQVQFNELLNNVDSHQMAPAKRKSAPRKWREIEELKAQITLAKELREIDPSYSFTQAEII